MRKGIVWIMVGAIILIFGIIFQFQGQGVVGPEASFMYQNSEWITYGQQMIIVGIIISGIGIRFVLRTKKSHVK